MTKKLGEGRHALSEETVYDSGVILSDQDEGSVGDLQVYKIPVRSSSFPSSTALKGVYLKLEIILSGHYALWVIMHHWGDCAPLA